MNAMSIFHGLCHLRFISLWFFVILRATDGSDITWFEPPPVEKITNEADVRTVERNLTEGLVNELTWNFSLGAGLSIITVTIRLTRLNSGTTVATFVQSPQSVTVSETSKNRVNLTWIPTKATLIIFNVTSEDDGEFSCDVLSLGPSGTKTWTRKIQVTVLVPTHITHISGNQTVSEGDELTLNCTADGNPTPTSITWTRLSDNSSVNMPLQNISRQDKGGYRCTADNGVGSPATKETFITVQYNPDNVTLVTNTTENKDCSVLMVVNFTCVASEANPTVTKYQLLESGSNTSVSNSGMWIKEISGEGKHVYGCLAEHPAGNKPSANVTLTKNVPVQISVNLVKGNETLEEGGDLSLYCKATGFPDPNITWTKVGVDDPVARTPWLNFTNIKRDKAGNYTCHANNTCGNASVMTSIDVQYPPNITYIFGNQTVNDTDPVSLNCIADGNPPPIITWTRCSDSCNNDGSYQFSITGRQDGGKYTCIAHNGIGSSDSKDIFILVKNYRPTNSSSLTTNASANTVVIGTSFTLNCSAQANPPAKYRFYREQQSLFNTTIGRTFEVYPTSVSDRVKLPVTYKCIPFNEYGDGPTQTVSVTVQFNPVTVSLVSNTTENEDCSESMSVNFTCNASDANPAVTKYQLLGNGEVLSNENGTWIKNISKGEKYVYSCLAEHPLGNVTSANTVNLTFNVPALVISAENKTVREGYNVTLSCNVSGVPPPNVTWTYEDRWIRKDAILNILNIRRNYKGEYMYKCIASNRCGNDNKTAFVDVQYKPENVTLSTSGIRVCKGREVTFTCTADANPPVHTYRLLYENGSVIENLGGSGVTTRALKSSGQFNYSCNASNSEGTGKSNNTVLTVEVPVQISLNLAYGNVTLKEGGNVSLYCNVTGSPEPTVTWTKDGAVLNETTPWLNFPNISRRQTGNYTCHASNACGKSSSSERRINVLFPASVISAENKTVNEGDNVTLFCNVSGVPSPNVSWIRVSDNRMKVGAMWQLPGISKSNGGKYKCIASNRCGNDSKTAFVDVQYKPGNVTLIPPNSEVCNGSMANFTCIAIANPPVDTYSLYEDGFMINSLGGSGETTIAFNRSGQINFSCKASNSEGNGISNNSPLIVKADVSGAVPIRRVSITSHSCSDFSKEMFIKEVKKVLRSKGVVCPEIDNITCGSVIVDLVLRFNQSVNEIEARSLLFNAALQGDFGSFTVDPESIKQTSQSSTASPSPTGTRGTQVPVCEETFLKNADCSTIVWKIVVLAVAGVVLIAFVVGIIAWWVHKRRKCGKDPRIHNSEERLHGNTEGNAYSQVNHGYAGTGPRPNGTEAVALQQRAAADGSDAAAHRQEAAAIPTYAEVDKSKKKKKAEEKLDYTYAEVDKSKKSKKKPKPGEMIYADLEDINVPRPMPTVSTSPQPLPPIKRPEPYENTQYADITQFLKGDATLPQSDSNQGTELQPQGANKDEDSTGGEDRNTPISRQDVQFGIEGNTDAQVNNKYAESGPAPANETDGTVRQQKPEANRHEAAANQQAAAAPPTYAAVDKSKKKSKRKKEEEKSPGSSVVDKSQTKKQSDDTYAQVDKSKKSIKKQPNPEGVIYADLEGVNMPRMPQVSTSPQPLPPLMRPTPYEGTEYADITEFRKGDASPKTDDCVNPEMQAQGTNKDGIGENNNETSF